MSTGVGTVPATPRLVERVVRAGSFTLASNVASQLLRFASNLVLTRLLFPEAFGLMSIAQSILAAATLLSDVGLSQSVIRSVRGHETRFLNTIWTLQILKGGLIFLVMCIASAFVARGYKQPALVALIPALGLGALINGFSSTKVALVNRNIDLGRLTFIELGSQAFGIIVMLVWAKLWPTPWALAGGNVANALALTAGSHLILRGPGNRFGWDKSVVHEVWKFGGWVMMSSGVTFLAGEGRNLLNAALVDAKTIGLMVLSSTLAFVVWTAIQQISQRVLFPAYSEVWRERREGFSAVVERSRRFQLLGGCCAAMVFALFGNHLVALFYDARYREAGVFLQIQAVGTMFSFLWGSYNGVLWAVGRPGVSTLLVAMQVAASWGLIFIGHALAGPLGVVVGGSCTGLVMYPVSAYVYSRFGLFQPKTDVIPILFGLLLAAYVYHSGDWAAFAH